MIENKNTDIFNTDNKNKYDSLNKLNEKISNTTNEISKSTEIKKETQSIIKNEINNINSI